MTNPSPPGGVQWLGSPNFTPGRQGHDLRVPPSYIVIHTMVGTVAGANARFQQPDQQASAHYGVGLDGQLYQWVAERDTAWHAGVFEVNLDSIGIEHEDGGRPDDPRPPSLYAASGRLVRSLCLKYGIPIAHGQVGVRSGIVGHRETGYATSCPDALQVDLIVYMAAQAPPHPTPEAPRPVVAPWRDLDDAYASPLGRVAPLPQVEA